MDELILLLGEDAAERRLDELPFALAHEHVADVMVSLPNDASLKFAAAVRGHCPSGPVNDTGERDVSS